MLILPTFPAEKLFTLAWRKVMRYGRFLPRFHSLPNFLRALECRDARGLEFIRCHFSFSCGTLPPLPFAPPSILTFFLFFLVIGHYWLFPFCVSVDTNCICFGAEQEVSHDFSCPSRFMFSHTKEFCLLLLSSEIVTVYGR